MISDFYDTTYTVKRSGWTTDGDGNPYSAETQQGTFVGHKQQADARLTQQLGLALTKTYSIWCDVATDVQEGDTISDDTTTYSVRAIRTHDYGTNQHLALIVEQDDID